MTNILLLLSLALNGIALLCIVILYLRQNRFLQVEKKQEKLIKEMEEVISTYLMEMSEENEKFIKKVRGILTAQSTSGPPKNEFLPSEKPVENKEEPPLEELKETPKEKPIFRKGSLYQAVQAYKSNNVFEEKREDEISQAEVEPHLVREEIEEKTEKTNNQDLYTQSFYYQVLLLQKQGLTTEEIAKRLNRGKTEIELLLKLRQNEK